MRTLGRPRRAAVRRTIGIVVAAGAFAVTAFAMPAAGAATAPHGRVLAKPCLNLNDSTYVYGKHLACIPYNTTIAIQCTDAGDQVRGPYGVSYIWDKTTYQGKTGYVADAMVYTGTNNPVAPSCLGKGMGRVIRTPCLRLRADPSQTAASFACVPYQTVIAIDCTKQGDAVTGPWATTKVWDHTTYGGRTGYVTDAWVYTGKIAPNAKPC
jgi:hypothetical protein